ncbi:MAG: histidine--tRNA ligase [Bdellovibrionota bacterium]
MKLTSIKGMNDILPPEIHIWQTLEQSLRFICTRFGFEEIRTPVLEQTALFKRGVGEDTDIVEKEMYSFTDKGGENISLRPEGTASVVRSLVENSWFRANPVTKLYYIGPMYRYERPQKGRFRQFNQFGIELLGVQDSTADVEVIALMDMLLQMFKLENVELHLSSIGCDVCRPPYKKILIKELEKIKDQLPQDFLPRIQTNPQRVFDLKDENAKKLSENLPVLMDHLCPECANHFDGVKKGLTVLQIPFVIDPKIVRGLDYYTKTAFEFVSSDLGAQSTVCGGGRYDKLVEQFGGPATPAVGFGMGLERFVLILQEKGYNVPTNMEVSVVYDEAAKDTAFTLSHSLRAHGFKVDIDLQSKNIKNQLKRADKVGSLASIVIGSQELGSNTVMLKDMKAHDQKAIPADIKTVIEELNQILRRIKRD